jgi:hypothetical protein
VKEAFKFRDPDAWDKRFIEQAAMPSKMKDEWCEMKRSHFSTLRVFGLSFGRII